MFIKNFNNNMSNTVFSYVSLDPLLWYRFNRDGILQTRDRECTKTINHKRDTGLRGSRQ